MKKEPVQSQSARSRFDLSQMEKSLDAIFQRADERLLQLVSNEKIQAFRQYAIEPYLAAALSDAPNPSPQEARSQIRRANGADSSHSEGRVSYQIRLGSVRLSLAELGELEVDAIVPLLNSTNGQVQIWSEGKLRGHGALLVADGKLIVRVESIEP